jgi:hypothetical protein
MRELQYPSYSNSLPARISWSAIFAGASVSFVVMACLGLLGTGIGLASAPAADTASGLAKGLGIGGGVWLLVSGFAAFYAGGWISGRLTSLGKISDSVIHGLLSWTTATLAFFLMTSLVAGGLMGSLIGTAGHAAAENSDNRISQPRTPGSAADRIQAQTGVTPEQGRQAAETAAKTTGAVGLGGFFILGIEALASMLGARSGTREIKLVSDHVARRTEPALR